MDGSGPWLKGQAWLSRGDGNRASSRALGLTRPVLVQPSQIGIRHRSEVSGIHQLRVLREDAARVARPGSFPLRQSAFDFPGREVERYDILEYVQSTQQEPAKS